MPNARIFPFSLLLTLSVALLAVEHNRIPLDQQTRPGSRPLLPPHGENRKKKVSKFDFSVKPGGDFYPHFHHLDSRGASGG